MPLAQSLTSAPSLLNPNVAPSRGDASDSDSDAELVSHIHPDLLLQHQNQLSMQQQQAPNGIEEGLTTAEGGGGLMPESACLWSSCGKSFGRLDELVQHIHKEHVGTSKSTYKCMWEGCQLYGVNRTSRFALIGHIRSHTGERPFTCKLPECDKSFTRSDALTKHMRVVHGIEPLTPHAKPSGPAGAAASKKRKRGARAEEESEDEELPQGLLESAGEDDGMDDAGGLGTEDDTWNPHTGKGKKRPSRKGKGGAGPAAGIIGVKNEDISAGIQFDTRRGEALWSDDESDNDAVYQDLDPQTGTVMGTDCTPSKAKYLLGKAKYRFTLGEHERLLERLTFELDEVKRLRDEKDEALNDLIRRQFGTAAEQLIKPISSKTVTNA